MDLYTLLKVILIIGLIIVLIFGFAITNDEKSGYNE